MERNLKQIPNLLSRHFFPPLHLSLQSNTVVSYGFTPLHSYTAYGSFQLKTLFWCFRTFHASRSSFCYLHRHQALAVTHLELMLQTGIATVRAKHAILGKGALQVKEPGKELFNQSLLLVQHTESWDGHLLVKWIAFFLCKREMTFAGTKSVSGNYSTSERGQKIQQYFFLSWVEHKQVPTARSSHLPWVPPPGCCGCSPTAYVLPAPFCHLLLTCAMWWKRGIMLRSMTMLISLD